MKPIHILAIITFIIPFSAFGQFGPKKKDLQSRIDTLGIMLETQKVELNALRFQDSLIIDELKHLNNELKDLKQLNIDLNNVFGMLREENSNVSKENAKLKRLYDELVKKVEIHQILIRNVIGRDSLDDFEKQIEDESATPSTGYIEGNKNFAAFAAGFMESIKSKGELGLPSYLTDKQSFYYLSKPGFITSVSEIKEVNELTEEIPWRAALEAFRRSKFSLIEGEKPEINCEMTDLYNKRGCYGGIEQDFDKVSKALIALKEFNPDEDIHLDNQIEDIKRTENAVVSFIFSTDGNLGFYFIKAEGTWKLYCVIIEDPCSA